MSGSRGALIAGLIVLVLALVATLLRSPMRTNGAVSPPRVGNLATATHSSSFCQSHEVLPSGSTGIRVWVFAGTGRKVRLSVSTKGRTITTGESVPGWSGGSVFIPVRPLLHSVADATVCIAFSLRDETMYLNGYPTNEALAAREQHKALAGRFKVEYLKPGDRSWLSMASEVARRMGLGRAAAGTWIALLFLALLVAVTVLTANLTRRELP